MLTSIRSYLWYYKYFWLRFVRDGLEWGRENLIGFLLTLAILLSQIRLGVLQPANANAEFWSIAYPYAILATVWFLFHFTVTAWRLDRERGEREELPLRLSPFSTRTGNLLMLNVENLGQADEFTFEITRVWSWEANTYPELPAPSRCVNDKGKRVGTVTLAERAGTRIELGKLSDPKTQVKTNDRPTITVYFANGEHQAWLRWKNEAAKLVERVVIDLRIRSNGTGRQLSASFVVAGSYGTYFHCEIYRFQGTLAYALPASPDP
jgi:hypothetical protein